MKLNGKLFVDAYMWQNNEKERISPKSGQWFSLGVWDIPEERPMVGGLLSIGNVPLSRCGWGHGYSNILHVVSAHIQC